MINQIAQEHPILVDKYLMGKEIEVDAVCDGEDILIPGIMEHIERAGIPLEPALNGKYKLLKSIPPVNKLIIGMNKAGMLARIADIG